MDENPEMCERWRLTLLELHRKYDTTASPVNSPLTSPSTSPLESVLIDELKIQKNLLIVLLVYCIIITIPLIIMMLRKRRGAAAVRVPVINM
jgi:hypothetical protein